MSFLTFYQVAKLHSLYFNLIVLQSAKARLKLMTQEFKDLEWEHEVLEQRFEKV